MTIKICLKVLTISILFCTPAHAQETISTVLKANAEVVVYYHKLLGGNLPQGTKVKLEGTLMLGYRGKLHFDLLPEPTANSSKQNNLPKPPGLILDSNFISITPDKIAIDYQYKLGPENTKKHDAIEIQSLLIDREAKTGTLTLTQKVTMVPDPSRPTEANADNKTYVGNIQLNLSDVELNSPELILDEKFISHNISGYSKKVNKPVDLLYAAYLGVDGKETLSKLVSDGIDVNFTHPNLSFHGEPYFGYTALTFALKYGLPIELVSQIIDADADVKAKISGFHEDVLGMAVFLYPEAIDMLVARGAQVNRSDRKFNIFTYSYRNVLSIQKLIQHQADPNSFILTEQSTVPGFSRDTNYKLTPLMHFIDLKSNTVALELLKSDLLDVNLQSPDTGLTAAHFLFSKLSKLEVLQALPENVNLTIKDKFGKTPVDYLIDMIHSVKNDKYYPMRIFDSSPGGVVADIKSIGKKFPQIANVIDDEIKRAQQELHEELPNDGPSNVISAPFGKKSCRDALE